MTDVFISYSRRDKVFVRRLFAALQAQGRESWVDWESIPYSAEWWREIQSGIEAADTLIFVITPDSLGSRICNDEFAYALKLNKRIIPVIRRDIDERQMAGLWFNQSWEPQARGNWETLKKINWLFFRRKAECQCEYDDQQEVIDPACDGPDCDYDDFDKAFAELVKTLETDIEHVKAHTRLLVRAQEWESKGRNRSYLLSGDDLRNAESWLAASGAKEPKPAELHTQYILSSRQATTARQRTTVGALTFGLVVALALALLSFVLFQQSESNLLLANERGTGVAQQAGTATNALGLSEQRGTEVAQQAEIVRANYQLAEARRHASDASTLLMDSSGNALLAALLSIRSININDDIREAQLAAERLTQSLDRIYAEQLFEGDGVPLNEAEWSPDETLFAFARSDGVTHVYDAASEALLLTLEGHTDEVTAVAFSPDGQRILTGSADNTALIWDVATGELLLELAGHEQQIVDVEFSPDGAYALTASFDGTAILWDAQAGTPVHTLGGHSWRVIDASFSPDGNQIVTASREIKLWDASTGEEIRAFQSGDRLLSPVVLMAAFDPNAKQIVTLTTLGEMVVWDVETGAMITQMTVPHASGSLPTLSPKGDQVLIPQEGGTASLWDISAGESARLVTGHDSPITRGAFSADGRRVITVDGQGIAMVWNLESSGLMPSIIQEGQAITSVAFSPDGTHLLETHSAPTVNLWDAHTYELVTTLDGREYTTDLFWSSAFSPDGTLMLTTGNPNAILWDVETGEPLHVLRWHSDIVQTGAFSPDGQRVVTASRDGGLVFWDVETGDRFLTIAPLDTSVVLKVVYTPDGRSVIVRDLENQLYFRSVSLGASSVLETEFSSVTDFALSPDGNRLLIGLLTNELFIYERDSQAALSLLGNESSPVYTSAFSPDGQFVVTGNLDGTMILWDATTGERLRVDENTRSPQPISSAVQAAIEAGLGGLETQRHAIFDLAVSPDSRRIVTANADGSIRFWYIYPRELADYACQQLAPLRDFTPEERQRYFIPDDEPTCPQFAEAQS